MSRMLQRQFELCKLRALRAHAEIVSGAYKFKNTYLVKTIDGHEELLANEELLQLKVEEMNRHISLADETMESLAVLEGGENADEHATHTA